MTVRSQSCQAAQRFLDISHDLFERWESWKCCFVLLDWWQDGYDLKQRNYTSPLDHPGDLVELSGDAVGCVWELEVLLHERAAWIDHVLNSEADDYQAYLQDVFPPGHGHGSTPDATTGGVTSPT